MPFPASIPPRRRPDQNQCWAGTWTQAVREQGSFFLWVHWKQNPGWVAFPRMSPSHLQNVPYWPTEALGSDTVQREDKVVPQTLLHLETAQHILEAESTLQKILKSLLQPP